MKQTALEQPFALAVEHKKRSPFRESAYGFSRLEYLCWMSF
jgi:hypothetical protein